MSIILGLLLVSICLNTVLIYTRSNWKYEFIEDVNEGEAKVNVLVQRQKNKLYTSFKLEDFQLNVVHDLSLKNKELKEVVKNEKE